MMTVDAIQTKDITIDLSDWTVRDIVLTQLYKLFDLKIGMYIKDDNLMIDEVFGGGSDSWTVEKTIREATEEDIAAMMVIEKVKKEL